MGYYVNPSAESFAAIARSKTYVDKTGLIEYMNTVVQTDRMLVCSSRQEDSENHLQQKCLRHTIQEVQIQKIFFKI